MSEHELDKIYMESLEEKLVSEIARETGSDYSAAMNRYFRSRLCEMIERGRHGIQYLDHRTLAQILLETEPELFDN